MDDTTNHDAAKISDHMANERTYLAWIRTGITIIALGFVVAKFGLLLKEINPAVQVSSFHLSSYIGIALVLVGGLMEILALERFRRNQERIKIGMYEPSAGIEAIISSGIFAVAIILIIYLVITL